MVLVNLTKQTAFAAFWNGPLISVLIQWFLAFVYKLVCDGSFGFNISKSSVCCWPGKPFLSFNPLDLFLAFASVIVLYIRKNLKVTQKNWIFFDKQVIQTISVILILGVAECTVKLSSALQYQAINCRKHSAVLTEFGAVGDGKTSNTKAFKAAIDSLSKYASDGGAQLIVPPGKWLTGSFSLTSHFTLFLHKDALILASQVRMTFFPHRNISPSSLIICLWYYHLPQTCTIKWTGWIRMASNSSIAFLWERI